jgi:hypothetical protein
MRHARPLLAKDGITGEKWPVNLACNPDLHINHKVLLHSANLRDGTDGFTSPLKEGILWIFFAPKIRRFQPGSNLQSWVLEASMLTTIISIHQQWRCILDRKGLFI